MTIPAADTLAPAAVFCLCDEKMRKNIGTPSGVPIGEERTLTRRTCECSKPPFGVIGFGPLAKADGAAAEAAWEELWAEILFSAER